MTTDTVAVLTYGLARPTVADLHACLTRSPGGDPQLWSRLCEAVHVATDTDDPTVLTELVAAALTMTTGTVRVTIASLNIRLRAHTALTLR